MIWEALTAIGTASTTVVILITVVLGARQVRAANAQLEHLRRTSLLEATMTLFSRQRDPAYVAAEEGVLAELPKRFEDESFRREVALGFRSTDPAVRNCMRVLVSYEEIGTYAKNGLLDASLILDIMSPGIIALWTRLWPLVGHFRVSMPQAWENFGYLYELTKRWHAQHGLPAAPLLPDPVPLVTELSVSTGPAPDAQRPLDLA